MKDKRFNNQKEIAEAFGVSKRTVSRWTQEGCPVLYTGIIQEPGKGSRPVYVQDEVEEWLRQRGRRDVMASFLQRCESGQDVAFSRPEVPRRS